MVDYQHYVVVDHQKQVKESDCHWKWQGFGILFYIYCSEPPWTILASIILLVVTITFKHPSSFLVERIMKFPGLHCALEEPNVPEKL